VTATFLGNVLLATSGQETPPLLWTRRHHITTRHLSPSINVPDIGQKSSILYLQLRDSHMSQTKPSIHYLISVSWD